MGPSKLIRSGKIYKAVLQKSLQEMQNVHLRRGISMSQGEKQRVLIGRALMVSPKLLILDEPCTGLDFLSKEQLLSTINQMANKQQMTILCHASN